MSRQQISRSPDLQRLRDEGFDLEVRTGHLLVKGVPYVNSAKEIRFGTLVSELKLAGDVTSQPDTHVAHFAGDFPCKTDGSPLSKIHNSSTHQVLAEQVVIDHSFSSKPKRGYYIDYYEKVTTYVAIIESQAQAIDSSVTARNFHPAVPDDDESVFQYEDTASSRAGIAAITDKLKTGKVGIVGLGGTGSYVLDLVAKCPIDEIHLFDGDTFFTHNAFRSPGAPTLDELRQKENKAIFWAKRYGAMHRHVIPHPYYVQPSGLDELDGMDFVFLCLDRGSDKRQIVDRLLATSTSFIDVGMGVNKHNDQLFGVLRVTAANATKCSHLEHRMPFSDGDGHNEYAKNIQIADLNSLNAVLAVIKWKKLCGFYLDLENEYFSVYVTDGNTIINEEHA